MSNRIRIFLAVSAMTAVAVCFNDVSISSGFPAALVGPAAAQPATGPEFSERHLAIRNPKYAGTTRDGRSYEHTANFAVLDMRNGERIFVDEPRVSLGLADGSRVTLAGITGTFDPRANALTMYSVVLTSAAGNAIRMGEALVDMRENSVISQRPVQIRFDDRTIRADRLELRDGRIAIFDGVIVQLEPASIVFFAAYGVQ